MFADGPFGSTAIFSLLPSEISWVSMNSTRREELLTIDKWLIETKEINLNPH
jgi:hypothetical protein